VYLDYWGLKKAPFDNVPDPAMYFDMHQSVEQAVAELLFAIQEGDDCLAVAVGPVGVGKTMCLRIVLDSLDHEKYRIAFVTNPDMSFGQLLREIVGQLEAKPCDEKHKDKLLERFNHILFETSDQGKRVVVFIDEGNVIRPHNLESLRLLTNMQDDHQNLFTIVLAGQPELGRRLEDPRRANLFQRVGVYCKLEGIDSRETMRDYIEHRLERAGNTPERRIFTADAVDLLWERSEGGIPRLVNKLCKLALKAAETNGLKEVDKRVVAGVADRFMRTYKVIRSRVAAAPKAPEEVLDRQENGDQVAAPEETPPAAKAPEKSVQRRRGPKKAAPTPPQLTLLESVEGVAATPTAVASAPVEAGVPAEIAPVGGPAPAESASLPDERVKEQRLSRRELEELASKLATERVKNITTLTDPFEAWEKARNEILDRLLKNQES
jgi:general secretion pathway protein A